MWDNRADERLRLPLPSGDLTTLCTNKTQPPDVTRWQATEAPERLRLIERLRAVLGDIAANASGMRRQGIHQPHPLKEVKFNSDLAVSIIAADTFLSEVSALYESSILLAKNADTPLPPFRRKSSLRRTPEEKDVLSPHRLPLNSLHLHTRDSKPRHVNREEI